MANKAFPAVLLRYTVKASFRAKRAKRFLKGFLTTENTYI